MGGGWLLAVYAGGWLAILVSPFVRVRILLLPGTHLASAHLLLAGVILADAAVAPAGIPRLAVPLTTAILLAALSRVLRDTWLLLGTGQERALDQLERLCRERGVEVEHHGGTLVLKRLGTGVRRRGFGSGLGLVLLDRRRREPEVDRLAREWRRALSGPKGRE